MDEKNHERRTAAKFLYPPVNPPALYRKSGRRVGMVLTFDASDSVYRLNGVPAVALPPATSQ